MRRPEVCSRERSGGAEWMSEAVARLPRPQGVHSAADLSRQCDWDVATKASPIFLGVDAEHRLQAAGRLSAPVCALMSAMGVGISTCRCIVMSPCRGGCAQGWPLFLCRALCGGGFGCERDGVSGGSWRQGVRRGSECLNTAAGCRAELCSRLSPGSWSTCGGGWGAQGGRSLRRFPSGTIRECAWADNPDGRGQQAQRRTRSGSQASRHAPERLSQAACAGKPPPHNAMGGFGDNANGYPRGQPAEISASIDSIRKNNAKFAYGKINEI